MDYTPRVDGFQIRDPVYLGYRDRIRPPRYDIVKWEKNSSDAWYADGHKEKMPEESCYSVAFLNWNVNDESFTFESCGTRWLEAHPTDAVIEMIKDFAENEAEKLRNKTDSLRKRMSWVAFADRPDTFACPFCDTFMPIKYKYCPNCGNRILRDGFVLKGLQIASV